MDNGEDEEVSEDEDWSAPLEDADAGVNTEPNFGDHGNQEPEVYHSEVKDTDGTQTESLNQPAPPKSEPAEKDGLMSRMQLNDHKAGMQGLDRERINKIIYEASKGSRFYENEMKKERQMTARIDEQQSRLTQLSPEQIQAGVHEADVLLRSLENSRNLGKTIVHVDMDAFYAAVEMRDNPALRNVPMAVGGNSMLSTSNYIARRFGVRAAMPGFIGRKLCPDLVIVPTNFDKYTAVSKQIREVMADYDPNFCPMSLDEAYLDITEHLKKRQLFTEEQRTFWTMLKLEDTCKCDKKIQGAKKGVAGVYERGNEKGPQGETDNVGVTDRCQETCTVCGLPVDISYGKEETFGLTAEEAVREMRTRMHWKTKLTASAGIAPNTMLAKVCSDRNKPNGQYYLTPTKEVVLDFVRNLDIRKVSGIGKVAERMLRSLGVKTCADLYTKRGVLYHLYSETSLHYFLRISIGIGSTTVERDGERKSMSVERTFTEIRNPKELYQKCQDLSNSLSEDLNDEQLVGKTVGIKLKTVKFDLMTRAQTLLNYTSDAEQIYAAAHELLKTEILQCQPEPLRLRLMGVRMSNLMPKNAVGDQKQRTITSLLSKMKSKAPNQDACKGQPSDINSTLNTEEVREKDSDQKDENSNRKNSKAQGNSLWLRSGRIAKRTQTYLCPICSENVDAPDLEHFNRHVDECLAAGPQAGIDQETSLQSKEQSARLEEKTVVKTGELYSKETRVDPEPPVTSEVNEGGSVLTRKDPCAETAVCDADIKVVDSTVVIESCDEKVSDTRHALESGGEATVLGTEMVNEPSHPLQRHATQQSTKKDLRKNDLPILERSTKTGTIQKRSAAKVKPSQKSKKLTCPVCNEEQDTSNLMVFNKHVDHCLNKGMAVEQSSCVEVTIKPSTASCSSNIDQGTAIKTVSKKGPLTQMAGFTQKPAVASNVVSQNTNRTNLLDDEEPLSEKVMTCPVCELSQEWVSLDAFSRHVDACLNRATIKEMLQSDPSSQNKRKLSPSEEPSSKRKKGVGKGIQRIDSFFK